VTRLLSMCLVLLLATGAVPTWAGPPPQPQTATLTLNNPPSPALGLWVTFTATYPKKMEHYGMRIQVLCYQDGNLVYGEAGPHDQAFLLGGASSPWQDKGGPAACVAHLYYWTNNGGQQWHGIASTSFAAGG